MTASAEFAADGSAMVVSTPDWTSWTASRIAETLRQRWPDVDFARRQQTVGAGGLANTRKHRVVDFNAPLETHLKEMHRRRPQDSDFLFPSPRRGEADVPIVKFNKAFISGGEKAGLDNFGFHDCRHYFISYCVMSGIDFMTIARWVGHQDGGVLIGKFYGHLSNEQAQRQAQRVSLPKAASANQDICWPAQTSAGCLDIF